MNTLLLASGSASRKKLLQDMDIPFQAIEHRSDEQVCDWNVPVEQLVESIAQAKMESILMPDEYKKLTHCFVLTADTLCSDSSGAVHGKPVDLYDARRMIKALRGTGKVATAFCLDRKKWDGNAWIIQKRITNIVTTHYLLDIPDSLIERYIKAVPNLLSIAGALTIDGFGCQFLKSINGSYSSIIGLPAWQLRVALEEVDFFG